MIKEHDRIVLSCDLPTAGLRAGDVGAVVHVYGDGKAFEVEFVALDGRTVAVVTVEADQLRLVRRGEMTHSRPMAETTAG